MYRLHAALKKPFFGKYQKPWQWPAGIDRSAWEPVVFPNRTGTRIQGLLQTTPRAAVRGGIVFAHPLGNAAKGFWLRQGHADWLRDLGYHTLVFDFNGFGESANGTFDYPGDVLAAGTYLATRFPQLPLAVVGTSFGAGWAICALAEPNHPFQAAVLEGVFPTLPDYWQRYPFAQAMLRISQLVYPRIERTLRPLRAAAHIQGTPAILLVYGEADTITPPAYGEQLIKALPAQLKRQLVRFPDVAHTFAFRDARAAYCETVTAFLEHRLVGHVLTVAVMNSSAS
jgi:uncharacterized protein